MQFILENMPKLIMPQPRGLQENSRLFCISKQNIMRRTSTDKNYSYDAPNVSLNKSSTSKAESIKSPWSWIIKSGSFKLIPQLELLKMTSYSKEIILKHRSKYASKMTYKRFLPNLKHDQNLKLI